MYKNEKKLSPENNTHLQKIKQIISSQPEELKKLQLFLKDIIQNRLYYTFIQNK